MSDDLKKLGMVYLLIAYVIMAVVIICITYFINMSLLQGLLLLAMFVAGMCTARGLELAWVRK